MLISELFVRVGADVSGLERGMTAAQRATQRTGVAMSRNITSAAQSGTLNVNKLGGAFLTLASQATGVNPAVARLTNVLGAFAIGGPIMIGVLAGITAASVGWRLWTKDAREAEEATKKLVDRLVESGKAAVAASIPGLQGQRATLETSLADAIARRDKPRSILQDMVGAVDSRAVLNAREEVARLSAALLVNEQAINKAEDAYQKMLKAGQSLGDIVGDAADAYAKAQDKITEALSKRLDAQTELILAREKADNFGSITAVGVGTGAGEILPTGMVVNLDRMKATLKDLPDLVRLTTDRVFQLGADAEIVTDKMASFAVNSIDAFAAFAVGAGGSMKDFVDGALQELTRLILKMAIVAGLKSLFAGSTGGFGLAMLGQLEGRASGGHVNAGQPYRVGERGPEMFVPSSSGSIVPNGGAAAYQLPALPRPMSPTEAATQAWFIEAIRIVTRNNEQRG